MSCESSLQAPSANSAAKAMVARATERARTQAGRFVSNMYELLRLDGLNEVVRSVARLTRGAPHANATVRRSVRDHGRRQLDHDREVVDAAQEIHGGVGAGGRAECQRTLGDHGEWARFRSTIGEDAEERLEVNEERIVARAREQLYL